MKKALIGKKIGMTQYIDENGTMVPVTVCELGPCVVVQKKSVEKDGYSALKLGYQDVKESKLTMPIAKDLKKRGIAPKRIFREVNLFDEALDVGTIVDCSIFAENQVVNIIGTSKGKGFAGVVKRHGFSGGRMTHGSHFHRAPGSVGACAYPSEIWKGKKMPGRHGSKKTTIKNLKIVKIFKEKNLVLILGAVPGRKNSLITVSEK
ncbi:MAG: 50S ribosomal protein L3 [Spirochaetae bacterium HGW-Spirochaetae-1]|jgi:large subunit ribosomal protein L3|nr:MAG: 50S ribosomal protein L3 [Spirochaetae bacterium HGW-Spirochaetae-1]